MSPTPEDSALTREAAATRLGVTPTRISQMLDNKLLSGPTYEGRAPRNAPRVWVSAIADYEQGLAEPVERPTRKALVRALTDRDATIAELRQRLQESGDETLRELRFELGAARAALQLLNVQSDVMVDRVEELLQRVATLEQAVAQRDSEVASLRARREVVKAALDSKTGALTQLLSPHSPPN